MRTEIRMNKKNVVPCPHCFGSGIEPPHSEYMPQNPCTECKGKKVIPAPKVEKPKKKVSK